MNLYKLDDRAVATLLAALRLYQREKDKGRLAEEIATIATNMGASRALNGHEIDTLCERINLNNDTVRAIVQVSGGVVQEIITDTSNLEVVLVDYDNIDAGDKPGIYPAAVKQSFVSRHFRSLASGRLP
jgi:hypothetical protein